MTSAVKKKKKEEGICGPLRCKLDPQIFDVKIKQATADQEVGDNVNNEEICADHQHKFNIDSPEQLRLVAGESPPQTQIDAA